MSKKLGEGSVGKMVERGFEELRSMNAGQPLEAPTVEAPKTPSYESMLQSYADMAANRSEGRGLTR